jgi:molybdopterin molybdotransferase
MGVLAAVGVTQVEVVPRRKVGIISTGDELVEPLTVPAPGQVRDINAYALSGAVLACGGAPVYYGIVKDEEAPLKETLEKALKENDIVLLSGGSSVGVRDLASAAIASLGQPGVLFHGLSIKPGKPAVGAVVGTRLVCGLPGHPASAMVVFDLLIAPLIRFGDYEQLEQQQAGEYAIQAEIVRNMPSAAGREDFVRVRLFRQEGQLYAEPILGKSGLINTLLKADGLAYIPANKEGVDAGEQVRVKTW